jgi:hypothetical protein
MRFGRFVRQIYLPFYTWKWKGATTATNVDRLEYHLIDVFDERPLGSFASGRGRNELKEYLDAKDAARWWTGRMAVPLRAGHHARCQEQRLEEALFPQAQRGRIGLGQLPGVETDPFLPAGRPWS